MKLLMFINTKEKLKNEVIEFVDIINSSNFFNYTSDDFKNSITENIYSTISNMDIKIINENSIASINKHKIKIFPTLIFNNDDVDIYRWEDKMPTIEELIKYIKEYIQILKLSIPDVDWSIDD